MLHLFSLMVFVLQTSALAPAVPKVQPSSGDYVVGAQDVLKVLVFDDSYVHEVWNHSPHVRIVLFMNFWHPCFAAEEIPVLERFRAAYERSPLGRVHEDNQAAQRAHDVAMQAIRRATAAGTAPAPIAAR